MRAADISPIIDRYEAEWLAAKPGLKPESRWGGRVTTEVDDRRLSKVVLVDGAQLVTA